MDNKYKALICWLGVIALIGFSCLLVVLFKPFVLEKGWFREETSVKVSVEPRALIPSDASSHVEIQIVTGASLSSLDGGEYLEQKLTKLMNAIGISESLEDSGLELDRFSGTLKLLSAESEAESLLHLNIRKGRIVHWVLEQAGTTQGVQPDDSRGF